MPLLGDCVAVIGGREIGAVRVMEDQRADAGFGLHHHAFGQFDADFLGVQDKRALRFQAVNPAEFVAGCRTRLDKKQSVGHGIDAGRLSAFGCGPLHPVGDNATDTGRQANRRVAFQILVPAAAGLEVFSDCTAQP